MRALVTAGPTEEPIDTVRFIGNRSSGRMGIEIAEALLAQGFHTVLALGPIRTEVPERLRDHPRATILRFRSSQELESLLRRELPEADLVVMAAAVADFRPRSASEGKMKRTDAGLTLELEGVPDLLASTRAARKPGARVFGFALEPRDRLERSAREKLERKDLAGIVANPLETMDAPDIEGTLFLRDGSVHAPAPAGERVSKSAFAGWLATGLALGFGRG
ncbi:MAG: phosphopantothenoylcysteine decarboxylase [Phycisphaerales bacterium]